MSQLSHQGPGGGAPGPNQLFYVNSLGTTAPLLGVPGTAPSLPNTSTNRNTGNLVHPSAAGGATILADRATSRKDYDFRETMRQNKARASTEQANLARTRLDKTVDMEHAETSQRNAYFDNKRRTNDTGIRSRADIDAGRRQGSMENHNFTFAARDYAKDRKDDFVDAARSSHYAGRQEQFLTDAASIDASDRGQQAQTLSDSVNLTNALHEELDTYNHNRRSALRQQQADVQAAREQQRDTNAGRSRAERQDTLGQSTLDGQTREAYREAKADYDQDVANQGYEGQRGNWRDFIESRADADAVHRHDSIKGRKDAAHRAFVEDSDERDYVAATNAKHFSDLNRRDNRIQDQLADQDRAARADTFGRSRSSANSAAAYAAATEQSNQDSFHSRAQNSRAELDYIISDASTTDFSTRDVSKLNSSVAKGGSFTTSADMSR